MVIYGGLQVPRHKQQTHGTNNKLTAQTTNSRHKQQTHGTNNKLTAQTTNSRHKQLNFTAQSSKVHGTSN